MATKLNVAYIKTNGANTYDLLRVGATGNLEYASVNNLNLTTANVNELGSNLYYSNARVYANVATMLPTYTGNVNAGNIIANTFISTGTGSGTISSSADFGITATGNINLSATAVRSSNIFVDKITANIWSGLIAGNNIIIAANGQISANLLGIAASSNYSDANVASYLATNTGNIRAGNIIANTFISTGTGSGTISSSADFGITATGNINLSAANVFTSNITVNRITSNIWTGLYAANVIGLTTANVTELTNLYYTNARVYSNISPLLFNYQTLANAALKANVADLTTANVAEIGNSIYYTNARVYSNVVAMLPTYTGNINAGNIIANTIIGTGAGGSITGANLISTNVISATTWTGLYAANVLGLNTANVNELTNLYYTNARVYSNVIALLQTLAGNNIIIAANGQISANLSSAGGGLASSVYANGVIGLNTANVNEFGSNLYYTNARVYSNVISLLPTYTGNINAGNIIANTIVGSGDGGGFITGANLISTNIISATTWTGLYAANVLGLNTANVAELTNLYYTNARVYSNISPLLGAKANVSDLTTANVTESTNLYFTNARVLAGLVTQDLIVNNATIRGDLIVEGNTVTLNTATLVVEDKNIMLANGAVNAAAADGAGLNIAGAQANLTYRNTGDKFELNKSLDVFGTVTANSWGNLYAANVIGLTTANVTEVGSSIYYTNARVYSNVATMLPYYTGNISAGNVLANTIIGDGGSIIGANLISTNIISATTWTGLYASNVLGLNTANVAELTNLYYTNARVYSNISPLLFNYQTLANAALKANVVDLTTANVSELTNLYYTNARVYSNVIALLQTLAGNNIIIAANGQISANLLAAGGGAASSILASGVIGLNTANVNEFGSNLYYTNARVYSNVIALLPTYTGNLAAGNLAISGGVGGSLTGANLISANNLSATNWLGLYAANVIGLNTANVSELTNLYYTNARVYANISPLLTTANVSEVTNLYYTNTRVYSNVIALLQTLAGNNIIIAANGQISANLLAAGGGAASSVLANGVIGLNTANVNEFGSNLYYSNARVYSNVIALLPTYTGNLAAGNLAISGGVGGSLTGANLISANNLSAINWLNLYAANVIGLTTANVTELTNLYYTNARVYSNISPLLFNYQTLANAALKANVVDLTTANVVELTNLYYTNARVYSNVIGLIGGKANVSDLTTANIIELTNLYFTNARVLAGLVTQDLIVNNATIRGDLIVEGNTVTLNTATLVVEDRNIMLANGATNSATADGAGINITGAQANLIYRSTGDKFEFNKSLDVLGTVTANSWGNLYAANVIGLNTANVAELTNLYYTNARVYSNVATMLPYYTGNINAGNVLANAIISTGGSSGTISATNDFSISAGNNINLVAPNTFANNLTVNRITANSWAGLYAANVLGLDTANVTELNNLYYTNARVYSNVIALLQTLAGNNIIIAANGQISANLLAAGGGAASSVLANGVVGLNTANVNEFGSNLYYTNARVYSNVVAMLPTYTGNINAGNITANSIVSSGTGPATLSSTSDINLTSSGNINIFAANIRLGNIIVDNIRANSWSGLIAGNNIIIAANGQISANLLAASVNVNSVSGNLAVSGNVIANGAVIANSIISTGSGSASLSSSADINLSATGNINLVASNVYTSNITVNRITSNIWSGLYAANVIGLNTANVAELTNLYYTNARVYSNVIGLIGGKANVSDLTTANVTELTNLYYTNARVYSNVIALLPTLAGSGIAIAANGQITSTATSSSYGNANVEAFITTYTGNINAGNITANSIISSGASTGAISATADIILTAGGNINLVAANVFTSNITVNRITANAWVGITASNVVGLTTANVTELTNLYYTNARVYSNVIGLIAGKANVSDLTTANVAELTNLYYTNTRTYSNTIALLPTLAGSGIAIAANGQISSTASGTYSNANVAAFLTTYTGNINAGNITANSIISAGASTGAISATADIILTAGGNINLVASNVYTSNITVNNITSNIWSGLYAANVIGLNTANVTELTNLYYTNARVYSNVIALLQTLAGNNIIISANGQISANLLAAGGGSASSVLANGVIGLNTANVNEFGSNLYYTNARVYSNVIGILSTYTGNVGAGNVIISSGGSITGANLISTNVISATNWIGLYAANVIGLTTANVTELTNLYYTNARVYSNVIGLLNAKANVVDLTTANVAELTNLYYTNARVYSNVIALLPTLAGAGIAIAANGQISSTAASSSYGNANVAAFITTYSGNISAGNIIANAIVSGGTGGGGSITGANLISANNIIANTIISGYGGGGSITGANLISANNIIANSIISGSSGGGAITGANLIQSNNISSLNWIGLYTSNIIQSSGNLFLSNATLRDTILNLTDGSLAVDANGRIGVNFYANSQIITASSSFVNYNLNYSNTTNSSIFVAIEGIIQIPGVDYYVNGQTLTLTSAPDTGANIEVRYMGLKQSQGPQTPSTSMDTISAFLLMGA